MPSIDLVLGPFTNYQRKDHIELDGFNFNTNLSSFLNEMVVREKLV